MVNRFEPYTFVRAIETTDGCIAGSLGIIQWIDYQRAIVCVTWYRGRCVSVVPLNNICPIDVILTNEGLLIEYGCAEEAEFIQGEYGGEGIS